jgi:8-amino-7-oxononanoate synthase
MANLTVLTTLGAEPDAMIFSEALNHASLIDGARLAKAGVTVYPHGDLATLSIQLEESRAATKVVVTDSVFSMDGDLAPLPGLLELCERHGAWLVVDDAHGFGVLGSHGRGALEHFKLRSPNLVYVGTLGKAAGVGGAFIAAHKSVIELMIQRARPYLHHRGAAGAGPCAAHQSCYHWRRRGGGAARAPRVAGRAPGHRTAAAALAAPGVAHGDPAGHHRQQRRGAACRGRPA